MPIIAALVGIVLGAIAAIAYMRTAKQGSLHEADEKIQSAHAQAESLIGDAKRQAETLKKEALLEAKEEIITNKQAAEAEDKQRKSEIRTLENRVMQREESLDRRNDALDKREHQLSSQAGQVEKRSRELEELCAKQTSELERIADLTREDAHKELLDKVRGEVTHEAATIIRESEQQVRAECHKTAQEILSLAIQRCAADHTAEVTVTSVHIPSDDLKGRIIGREGRNIRTFEQVSGVNLVIDDTPETVVLSSFDPVRRETARVALENLIADGRIHPARIEEMYHKAADLVQQRVREAGEQAAFDTGIHDLHPEIVKTLGALRYRTSFGQNVLQHSLEVSDLCGVMASELGLDVVTAKRAGLLHDLGKAIDHDVEGPHAVIGAELARRYGEKPVIVHAIEAHHADVDPNTVLDVLVQAADAVSASRPGARRESAENYIKRLEKLEEIANSHDGVERTYAMQAGREVHVMVQPDKISDAQSTVLAHDIAHQIEEEMEYPGQVRVVVIRESRAVEDIVIEMLRNARDAGADKVYLATTKEDGVRTLVFLDNGSGVPQDMQERIFDARVTSKLESMKMDRWGVHGRGMALFSIKQNTDEARVVTSGVDLGSAFKVSVAADRLSERADQSSWPQAVKDEDGRYVCARGPHNIIRAACEFALEELRGCDVYLGSPSEIAATLYAQASSRLDTSRLLFIDDESELPVVDRLGLASDAEDFIRICSGLGLEMSERTAHRILAGQIKPVRGVTARLLRERDSSSHAPAPVDLAKDRRGLRIAKDDMAQFSRAVERDFNDLAARYYLNLCGDPKIRVSRDRITVTFDLAKEE